MQLYRVPSGTAVLCLLACVPVSRWAAKRVAMAGLLNQDEGWDQFVVGVPDELGTPPVTVVSGSQQAVSLTDAPPPPVASIESAVGVPQLAEGEGVVAGAVNDGYAGCPVARAAVVVGRSRRCR